MSLYTVENAGGAHIATFGTATEAARYARKIADDSGNTFYWGEDREMHEVLPPEPMRSACPISNKRLRRVRYMAEYPDGEHLCAEPIGYDDVRAILARLDIAEAKLAQLAASTSKDEAKREPVGGGEEASR